MYTNVYMWLHAWRWWADVWINCGRTIGPPETWLGPRRNMTRPTCLRSAELPLDGLIHLHFQTGSGWKAMWPLLWRRFSWTGPPSKISQMLPFWIGQGRRRFAFPLVLKASTWGTCGCRRMKQRRLLATACGSFPSTENYLGDPITSRSRSSVTCPQGMLCATFSWHWSCHLCCMNIHCHRWWRQ